MLRLQSKTAQLLVAKVYEARQEQIFAWWDELDADAQGNLLAQIGGVDFQLLTRLVAKHVKGSEPTGAENPCPGPPAVTALPRTPEDFAARNRCKGIGEDAIRGGRLAVFMAAGGLGTRLGREGPKGSFPVGPVSQKTVFQFHAEKVLALARRYRTSVPFLVMTSAKVHEPTIEVFRQNEFFGLAPGDVSFHQQPSLPVVNRRGRILMATQSSLAMSPNGHGGAFAVLGAEPARRILEERGIRHVFYFQVDNPLARIGDPVFLGFHIDRGAEVSSKAVRKLGPDERVGVFCTRNERLSVIEYSELLDDLKSRRMGEGDLAFGAANTAIHIFEVPFLDRIREEGKALPYHVVERATPYVDKAGRRVRPKTLNSFRFEQFIFDLFPLAGRTAILEVAREDEFSPIRNAAGSDSLESARRDLAALHGRWLRELGTEIPIGDDGRPAGLFEVSPLVATTAEELRERFDEPLRATSPFYLE
ncbi:MAG: UTP--glucose-1-phosphate uridylyltransferase [Planctomycetes bacterium]|nr:UTP--glucose-1-phosphate uridylyltransferase [Planctomycetota bacterium]